MKANLRTIRRELRQALEQSPEPQPSFDFTIGWSQGYDELLARRFLEETDIAQLVERSLETGRVLLCGRGGGGKTVILRRLARRIDKKHLLVVLVDLGRWRAPNYEDWEKCGEEPLKRLGFLLEEFATPHITPDNWDCIPANTLKLFLVDGLNEVSRRIGHEIIDTLDEFVQYSPHTSVIISDRLVRRELRDPKRWRFAFVEPLPQPQIEKHLIAKFHETVRFEQLQGLLSTPYFLDSVLRHAYADFRTYFQDTAHLADEELQRAGLAAFTAYNDDGTRTFALAPFKAIAGDAIIVKLRDAGALIVADSVAYFAHHLQHDYLASVYVVANPDKWSHDIFDVVSFRASSFETLAFALEHLDTTETADRFIRSLYDWSPYGAAYAVAEGHYRRAARFSQAMEVVMLAMNAERRWDLIRASARRAMDALRVNPTEYARQFLELKSLAELIQFVRQIELDASWFNEWKDLFTHGGDEEPTYAEIDRIKDTDSIIGWTVANVLRRVRLTRNHQEMLRAFLRDSEKTVRWRIVHVLGACPSRENAEILFNAFDSDPYDWVRYGATRSLVEMAARADQEVREFVVLGLQDRTERLLADEKVLREFEDAIFVRVEKAPQGWTSLIAPVIEKLAESAKSFRQRGHWVRLVFRLKEDYGA